MIENIEKSESVRELRLDELKSVNGGLTTSGGSGVGNTGFGAMWLTKALKYLVAPSA
jgi:hypothetical protein